MACAVLLAWLGACRPYEPELLPSQAPAPETRAGGGMSEGGVPDGGMSDGGVPGSEDATVGGDGAAADGSAPQDAGGDARIDAGPRDAAAVDAASPQDAGADTGAQPVDAGADADAAFDSGVDCDVNDCCPSDPDKTEPGLCGCGTPDTDDDGDGTPDCDDLCPSDPDKTAPGQCGCGIADAREGCLGLLDALRHRYRFDGTGSTVVDTVGTQDGTVIGTTLDGSGSLVLSGGSDGPYVDLPNGLVSALSDATFEVWVTWDGSDRWERVFDFGNNDAANEGDQGLLGAGYLFLTPRGASDTLVAAYSTDGFYDEVRTVDDMRLDTGTRRHLAVVVDDTNDEMALYVDSQQQQAVSFSDSLGTLDDINNWLGRSQYQPDPTLAGTLHEFRIYDAALDSTQLEASFGFGPDPEFLEP